MVLGHILLRGRVWEPLCQIRERLRRLITTAVILSASSLVLNHRKKKIGSRNPGSKSEELPFCRSSIRCGLYVAVTLNVSLATAEGCVCVCVCGACRCWRASLISITSVVLEQMVGVIGRPHDARMQEFPAERGGEARWSSQCCACHL